MTNRSYYHPADLLKQKSSAIYYIDGACPFFGVAQGTSLPSFGDLLLSFLHPSIFGDRRFEYNDRRKRNLDIDTPHGLGERADTFTKHRINPAITSNLAGHREEIKMGCSPYQLANGWGNLVCRNTRCRRRKCTGSGIVSDACGNNQRAATRRASVRGDVPRHQHFCGSGGNQVRS